MKSFSSFRYFRVVQQQHYKTLFGGRRSLFMLVFLWLVIASFVLYPAVAGVGEFNFNPALSSCVYTFKSPGAETVFTLIVIFILVVCCLLLVCFSYYHVSKTIREHNTGVSRSLNGVSVQEINLSKVLFILVFAFTLCWLPTFVIILITRVIIHRAPHALGVVIPLLMQTSSVLNPFIYGALSPPFKREFRRLLMFRCVNLSDEGHHNVSSMEVNQVHGTVSIRPQSDITFPTRARHETSNQYHSQQLAVFAWL